MIDLTKFPHVVKVALLCFAITTVVACGGGGGGANEVVPSANNMAPANVKLQDVSSASAGQITASWPAAADDATPAASLTYQLHVSTDAAFTPSASTLVFEGKAVYQATVSQGLTPGAVYTVKLVVIDGQGASTVSAGVAVTVKNNDTNSPSVFKLPHTGITASQCYSAGSNAFIACSSTAASSLNAQQDGNRAIINAMSYSKVGFSGEALADNASSWCAVKDNVTGLLWQNHQETPATFTNVGDNRVGDASKYVADNAALCGLSGWRLPTVDELQTIVDYSKPYPDPSINTTWFSGTLRRWYWSSSPSVGGVNDAWGVDFSGGFVINDYRYTLSHVRLVRASQ